MIRISPQQARTIANEAYIAAYAREWEAASPAERELATLEMKDRWSEADKARRVELLRLVRS